jgi:hypothetical protein
VDPGQKLAAMLWPAILMVCRDAGYFTGMATNALRRIGDNKFIHALPFYCFNFNRRSRCKNRAYFLRRVSLNPFLRGTSKNAANATSEK